MTSDDYAMQYGEFLSLRMRLTRKVYEALKELALDYLPTFNLLETNLVRSFNTCMNNYAHGDGRYGGVEMGEAGHSGVLRAGEGRRTNCPPWRAASFI
ncbi:MAG: hypothetical protein IPM82_30040 [Saprospiraceae bacterium]|nr:hypothetical protein [Saprospiraceae bacterium]